MGNPRPVDNPGNHPPDYPQAVNYVVENFGGRLSEPPSTGVSGPPITERSRSVPASFPAASSSASSSRSAPGLLSGSFPFPHFGDWMQEGQPVLHSQSAMAARVAASHSRAAAYPRSAKPAPPSWPS